MYYFSCTCGSKVYFDTPGPPWTQHAETCLPYQLHQLHSSGRHTANELRTMIEERAYAEGVTIPAAVYNQLAQLDTVGTPHPIVQDVPVGQKPIEEFCFVDEISLPVNFAKRLGYRDKFQVKRLLGKMGQVPYVELTLSTEVDTDMLFRRRYRAFAAESLCRSEGIGVHQLVLVDLEPRVLLWQYDAWFVRSIKRGDG